MRKFIVITTINYPTEAVKKFANIKDSNLVVVGDLKTPKDWKCANSHFISVESSINHDFTLSKKLPYNHYCRKMLGYLFAIRMGAEAIIDTDDDNYPKLNWYFPEFAGKFNCVEENNYFVNIYQYFTDEFIWPRGFPLRLLNQNYDFKKVLVERDVNVGIWQGLADEDPDVDAIYRMTYNNKPCIFSPKEPIVLLKNSISPFNSQNTIFRKELFPLMYLPTTVTFRFTDILRSLIAQPIMWLYGYYLGFIGSTVVQKRNAHNYFDDFLLEIPMYVYTEKVIEIVTSVISKNKNLIDNLYEAYAALLKSHIVKDNEINTLEGWFMDIENK